MNETDDMENLVEELIFEPVESDDLKTGFKQVPETSKQDAYNSVYNGNKFEKNLNKLKKQNRYKTRDSAIDLTNPNKKNDRMANQLASKGLQSFGIPKGISDKVINSKLGQRAIDKAKGKIPLLGLLNGLGGNKEEKAKEKEETTGGFQVFVIPPKVKLWIMISLPIVFLTLILFCAIIAFSLSDKVINLGNSDEAITPGAEEKLLEKLDDPNSLDEQDAESNNVSFDYFLESNNLKFQKDELKKLNFEQIALFKKRVYSEFSLDNLEEFYPIVNDKTKNYDKKMVYYFFLKLNRVYTSYTNMSNNSSLIDLPLIMSTLLFNADDMNEVFKSNLDSEERKGTGKPATHEDYSYEQDWSSYKIERNSSTHDIEVLAQNMVTKNGDSYEHDDAKYREFLMSYLNTKYYNGMLDEKTIMSYIGDIYDSKELYEELVGTYEEVEVINTTYSSNSYWWPIGSKETTVGTNGKIFATGDPVSVKITSWFGAKDIAQHSSGHGGIDIGIRPYGVGEVNVIAAKSGTVVYPTSKSQTLYKDGVYVSGSYGNYVKIEHSDGTYTIYGHMAYDSITVMAGEVVEQGQVIGKVGNTGESTGTHLHFEMRKGGDNKTNRVDPLDYVDPDNPRPISSGGSSDFSLVTTTLTKEQFILKMDDYCKRTNNNGFCNTFAANAEQIYTVSLANNINPELVVVTAGTEQGWKLSSSCSYTNNYWGLGIPNGKGCNAGKKFSSIYEGIAYYATVLATYNEGGSHAGLIKSTYDNRVKAGCKPEGHGLPGTFAGMQSVYSFLGTYRYNPGSGGLGGCYYLNLPDMYGQGYCSTVSTCASPYNNCSESSKTTICEQNDYTAFQLKKKTDIRYDIFGL